MLRTLNQKILQDAVTRHFARVPAARKKLLLLVQLSVLHPAGSWGSSGLPPFWCRTIVVVVPGYCSLPSSFFLHW